MRLVTSDGAPLMIGGTRLTTPGWEDLAAWTHCWDAADAQLYTPSASEQSNFGVSATPRVARIHDHGTGKLPMLKDPGPYGPNYGAPAALPGAQWIASSARFRGRPAFHCDQVLTSPGVLYSVMTPTLDWANTSTWFNAPNGIAAPWSTAQLVRFTATSGTAATAWDSTRGDTASNAMHTISAGSQLGVAGNISVSNWSNNAPGATITTGHAGSTSETYLILAQCKSGANQSQVSIFWRDSSGALQSDTTSGTLDATTASEMFFGWHHEVYVSCAGLKSGSFTAQEIIDITTWATRFIPDSRSIAAEP